MSATRWLIERGQSENQRPTIWWCGTDGDNAPDWTTDANRAVKFASQDSAQRTIDSRSGYVGDKFGRATEHVFLDSELPDTPSDDPPRAADATPSTVIEPKAFEYGEGAGSPGEGNDMLDANGVNVWTGSLDAKIERAAKAIAERAQKPGAWKWYGEMIRSLVAVTMPDKPSDDLTRATISTPSDNSNEINRLRAQVGSLTGALEEARRKAGSKFADALDLGRLAHIILGIDDGLPFDRQALIAEAQRLAAAARPPETEP